MYQDKYGSLYFDGQMGEQGEGEMGQGWMERIIRYVEMLVILKMLGSDVTGEVWTGDRKKE